MAGETRGWAPKGAIGSPASTTGLRTDESPCSSTSTTSPGSTGREPAGVPVRMMSPGSSVMKRERSATRSANGKIRFAVESSCASSPFTSARSVIAPGSTSPAGTGGPTGVKPSCPFAMTFEPRSFQRMSYTPTSFAGAYQPTWSSARSSETFRAARPMISATSASNVSSSMPCGRTIGSPSPETDEGGLKKYDGCPGLRPRWAARLS